MSEDTGERACEMEGRTLFGCSSHRAQKKDMDSAEPFTSIVLGKSHSFSAFISSYIKQNIIRE